jgi:murein DD-endopeptidase MepM/ murein hydrolase activator NlpD
MITIAIVINNKDSKNTPLNEHIDLTQPDDVNNQIDSETPSDSTNTDGDDTPNIVITDDPIVFLMPTLSGNIAREYNMTALIFWDTLGHYAVHDGIDFVGQSAESVFAVRDGVIIGKSYDLLYGNVIKIDHGDGLITIYGSLSDPSVEIGQRILAGEVIGTISDSGSCELELGMHLHFSVYKDNVAVNPCDYLPTGAK